LTTRAPRLVLLCAALGACAADDARPPELRVVVDPAARAATLAIDGAILRAGTAAELEQWIALPSGGHQVAVHADGAAVFARALELDGDRRYTILALPGHEPVVLDDGLDAVARQGGAAVRLVHAAASAGPIDLFVTAPGAALADAAPTLAAAAIGQITDFHDVHSGAARLRVTAVGTTGPLLYDSGVVELAPGTALTLVVRDAPAGAAHPVALTGLTDVGSFPLPGHAPCAEGESPAAGTVVPLVGDVALGAICAAGEEDVYRLSVDAAVVLAARLDAASLGSPLAGRLELRAIDGTPIDRATRAGARDAALAVMVLDAGEYLLAVSDLAGGGGPGHVYELEVGRASPAPLFEATAGTFTAASNRPGIEPFSGNLLAFSVRVDDVEPVDFKVMMRITHPTAGAFPYLYDPAAGRDGLLAVVLADDDGDLPRSTGRQLVAGAGAAAVPYAPPGLRLPAAAVPGLFRFDFPGHSLSRTVDLAAALVVPAPSGITLHDGRKRVKTRFTVPPGASRVGVDAFGRWNGAAGWRTATTSPVTVTLDQPLEVGEPFAVLVRAGAGGLIDLPLPDGPLHASEYLWFSDAPGAELIGP
jgi:hypothetical protein